MIALWAFLLRFLRQLSTLLCYFSIAFSLIAYVDAETKFFACNHVKTVGGGMEFRENAFQMFSTLVSKVSRSRESRSLGKKHEYMFFNDMLKFHCTL